MPPPLVIVPAFTLAAILGLKRDWPLGRWAVLFALLGWVLLAHAAEVWFGPVWSDLPLFDARRLRHEWVLFVVVACEAIAAALVLALSGFRARRRAATFALWLCALFIGALLVVA